MKTKTLLCTIFIIVLAGAVMAISNSVNAELFTRFNPAAAEYVPGEVLVKFKPMINTSVRKAAVMAQGHSVLANLNQPGWVRLKVGAGQTVDQALTAYRNDPNVEYVQPNYIYHLTAVPNDTQYGQLWAFKNTGQVISAGSYFPNFGTPGADINIEKAWDHITDCSSTVVAVVVPASTTTRRISRAICGTGIGLHNHGYNYVNTTNDRWILTDTGTRRRIIGAAGNNAKGTSGVCWKASIMAVRVMDSTGRGTTANIIQGVNFRREWWVVNMSIEVVPLTMLLAMPSRMRKPMM
jgi:hypothetical protein